MDLPLAHDTWIAGPDGRLFVRSWSPEPPHSPHSPIPIILLHDSLGCVELWRSFPAALCAATGRRVIAYDRLGFGRSGAYPGKLPLDFISREAETGFAALRRQLGIGRFVVFGHSVGGGMAVHCAARFAGDCVALVTESAQAFVEARTVRGIEDARELFKDPGQLDRLAKYHGDKAAWVLDAWIGSWLSPAFAAWSLAPVLPEVRCPLLVVHGNDDEYGSPRHPELIGQLASGAAQVQVLAGTRHVPHREQEEAIVALVAGFLRSAGTP
jgi:pimeloyl-ACP methyl ester carboxylesterase